MTTTPDIESKNSISPIWFLPIIAALLGVYMVIHTWMAEGPEIQIVFKTAAGLEAGMAAQQDCGQRELL